MTYELGEPMEPLELQPEEELERFKFRFEVIGEAEMILHTLFGGFPVTVTRIWFSDAASWHVRWLRVGNRDQLVEHDGSNAAHIEGPVILEKVVPGVVFSMNIRRAEGSEIADGEVVLYGRKHQ